jgi:hypothetical protein
MNVPLVNFNGGEIGVEAQARVDLDFYPTCAATMENALPLMQGAMIKAPGTEYVGRTYTDSAAIVRPFVFDVDQTRVLEFTDSRIDIVDGNSYVDIDGAAATIGTPVDNGSSGGGSVSVVGQNVTFTAAASGEAAAYWPITSGVNGTPVTFRFEIERRPLSIRVGTTTTGMDIALPGPSGTYDLTLDPGIHIITFTPTATSYYIRARLREQGKAVMKGLTRLQAGGGASGFFIPTPWLEADLPRLRYRQSLDTYWLYHPDYRPRVLERRANTSWSLRLFRPIDGPFETPNVSTTTFTVGALQGSTTGTFSAPMLTAASVGQLIEATHQGQTETETFSGVDQETGHIRVFGTETNRVFHLSITGTFTATVKLQRSVNEADWLDVDSYTAATEVDIDDELDNQIIYYRVLCSAYTSGSPVATLTYAGGETTGRAEIVEYVSATVATIEVVEDFGSTDATAIWSIGAWSDEFGWPAAGTLDDGRHALVRDNRFWASVSDSFESFLLGVDSADAIARRFGTGEMNSSRWIESGRRLLIGTSGAELEVTSNALDEPITPLANRLRGFDDNGSADTQAMKAGANRILFIDRTRTRLLQCLYDNDSNSEQHDTDDLTRLHQDIAGLISAEELEAGTGGFVEIAVQRRPEPRVWCVRSDGQLAVLLFGPREGVYAWARIKAAETADGSEGAFKSVCVIPGMPEDRVHVIVERTIDGTTRMHHERFGLQKFPIETELVADDYAEDGSGFREVRTAPDAWRLQAALYSTGAPADTFTGLDHLEGESVSIWADGRVHPARTVESGAITLDDEYETVLIGLNYIGKWQSVKLAYGAQFGTALTMEKSVGAIGFAVHNTPAGAVKYGRTFKEALSTGEETSGGDDLRETDLDSEGDFLMDQPAELLSHDYHQPFDGRTDIDARVCVVMDTPAPVTILGMVPGVELHERT